MAGASLALGISIKVWPLFFLPYFMVRREWRIVVSTAAFLLIMTFLPSLYFGAAGNIGLLRQWFNQEFQTQLSQIEIWFPNQSLRGVLMRYLTVVDYSELPDGNYRQINIAALDPAAVRRIWAVIAGASYVVFLFLANRHRNRDVWLDAGLGFCLLALVEPFTQKYALAMLLWPALALTGLMQDSRVRILVYGATVLALIQPLAPGATAQRLLQVLGLDFAATLLLACVVTVGAVNQTLTIRE